MKDTFEVELHHRGLPFLGQAERLAIPGDIPRQIAVVGIPVVRKIAMDAKIMRHIDCFPSGVVVRSIGNIERPARGGHGVSLTSGHASAVGCTCAAHVAMHTITVRMLVAVAILVVTTRQCTVRLSEPIRIVLHVRALGGSQGDKRAVARARTSVSNITQPKTPGVVELDIQRSQNLLLDSGAHQAHDSSQMGVINSLCHRVDVQLLHRCISRPPK
mmetsp:Transcript_43040/g.103774  ORF Transcript_43040/g.103774 Transcript_43040/m.103774 type:complete len:216 (-) Transcript_43040:27-674(-)